MSQYPPPPPYPPSGTAPQSQVLGYASYTTTPFVPLQPRASIAKVMIIILTCLSAALTLGNVVCTFTITPAEMESGEYSRQGLIILAVVALLGLLYIAMLITSAVFFCRWVGQAHRNASSLQIRQQSSGAGWAVGCWFVPIVNLFKPRQIVLEIYDASAPAAGTARQTINSWWGCWVGANILGNVSSRLDRAQMANASMVLDVLSTLLLIGAAIMVIKIINAIVERQAATVSGQLSTQ